MKRDAVCVYDKYGTRFIGLKWMKEDADKDLIVKAICNKWKMFISGCEILQ